MASALSFVLELSLDDRRRAEVAAALPVGPLFDAFASGPHRLEVILSEAATRVNGLEGGAYGRDWSLITRQQHPPLWLSTRSRHYLELPLERVPGCSFTDRYECVIQPTGERDVVGDSTSSSSWWPFASASPAAAIPSGSGSRPTIGMCAAVAGIGQGSAPYGKVFFKGGRDGHDYKSVLEY